MSSPTQRSRSTAALVVATAALVLALANDPAAASPPTTAASQASAPQADAARKQQMCDCLTVLYRKTELVLAYANREREVYTRVKIVDLQRPFTYVKRTDGSGIEECVVNPEAMLEVTSNTWTKDVTQVPIGPTTPAHGADVCAYLKAQGVPVNLGTAGATASPVGAGPTSTGPPSRGDTTPATPATPAAPSTGTTFGSQSATTEREAAIGKILIGRRWSLSRGGSAPLGTAIALQADGRVDGAVGVNVRTWRIQREMLVLCDASGVPVIVFNKSASSGGKATLTGQAFPVTRDVYTLSEIGPVDSRGRDSAGGVSSAPGVPATTPGPPAGRGSGSASPATVAAGDETRVCTAAQTGDVAALRAAVETSREMALIRCNSGKFAFDHIVGRGRTEMAEYLATRAGDMSAETFSTLTRQAQYAPTLGAMARNREYERWLPRLIEFGVINRQQDTAEAALATGVAARGKTFPEAVAMSAFSQLAREPGHAPSIQVLDFLFTHGADPNFEAQPGAGTMLFQAVQTGDVELVRMMVKRGANVQVTLGGKYTPLGLAEMMLKTSLPAPKKAAFESIVTLLRAAGAR